MTLSEIRRWLKERDIHLTKSLGQNFLHDPQQLERIVKAAELTRADQVLEIGPGLGPLTALLLQQAGKVLAIEKDRRLVQVLKERLNVGQASCLSSNSLTPDAAKQAAHQAMASARGPDPRASRPEVSAGASTNSALEHPAKTTGSLITGGTPGLQLVHDDALELLKREPRDWSDWKVVSNLPFSVASPILVELCQGTRSPGLMVVTLQLEVAERLMSSAGGRDYGVLTLLVQLDFEPVKHFRISRGCFFPEPDVDSACIVLRRRAEPLLPEELRPLLVRVVKRAFSQRRKMMKNLLRAEWPADTVAQAMAGAGLNPQVRAEAVGLTQFVALTQQLAKHTGNTGVPAGHCSPCATLPAERPALPVNPQPTAREEIFDVVNERDEIVGAASRAEVHARGLLHRAVHVLVFNARGEVFLQKRSMTKDKSPGLWDSSASGHLDRGEDYDTCAQRELREEIGLILARPPQRLFKLAACAETDQEHVWVYRCHGEGPFQLNPEEIECGEWLAPAEVGRRVRAQPQDYASAFRHLWGQYARQESAAGRGA